MKLTNNSARFGWIFSALCLLFLCGKTYTLICNGIAKVQVNPPSIPGNYQSWFILAFRYVFSGVGIGLAIHTAATPCVEVEVGACRKVRINVRYPMMEAARDNVLVFLHCQQEHWSLPMVIRPSSRQQPLAEWRQCLP